MSKEHAYAYEAGYRDGSVHYELEHCPACKNVADLQEALDENAKLRDELDFCLKYAPNCDECAAMLDCDECLRADASQKERKRLDYENDKLRELVEDMAAEMRGLGVDFKRVGWCNYADRMRELGVDT